MICIIEHATFFAAAGGSAATNFARDLADRIAGWIVATDLSDARRQAQSAGNVELAYALYRMEFEPSPGKHILPTSNLRAYVLLVS